MPLVLKAEPRVAIQLSAAEQRIYDAYRKAFEGIGELNDTAILRAIADAINANNPLGAVNAIAWGDFAASLDKTVDALNKEVIKSANASARSLPTSVRIAANFTTADPRAIAFAQQRAGRLIRQITEESRKAVTETIMEALRMRIDRREMVTRISKVVGLDSRQARALSRFYEKSLLDGRAAGLDYEEALAKADRLGDRYKKRLIRQRAVRIARTETIAASNAGRYLSWIEAEAQGLLGSDSVKRWITAIDERTCPICAPLNNKEVPYKNNFSTGELMPPVHPNCRCSAVIIPAEVSFIPLQKTVVSSDPIAAMFKHGTHDQSSHNPHKGGRGGGGSTAATAAKLLENADKGKVIDLGDYPANRKDNPADPYGFKTDQAKMGEVIDKQGWAEPSTGLTETEFEDLAKNPDFVRVYRGAPAASAQAMVDGKPYIGNGVAGPGTYITTSRDRAAQFAGKPDYAVVEMLVPKKLLSGAGTRDAQRASMISRFGANSVFDSDATYVMSAAGGNGATYTAGWARYTTDYVIYNTSALAVKIGS
jgi:SPP1 gp7 family putative phage head morphogenesis protein